MLCQLCTKNVALVEARYESNTVRICIPCALKIMDNDPDTVLELKRGQLVQKKETQQLEEDN